MANKLKSIMLLCGYKSTREFCKRNNLEYQSFLRKLNSTQDYALQDVQTISDSLNLTPDDIVEIFLPKLFQKMKRHSRVIQNKKHEEEEVTDGLADKTI
jgi:hypothetical protein